MKDLKKVTKRGEKNVEKHILYTMHNTYRLVCFNFIFSSTEEEKKKQAGNSQRIEKVAIMKTRKAL